MTSALLTFGHGTLGRDELGALVEDAGIERVVDIRRFPGSRANPAASEGAIEALLAERGIAYRWEERLGGRRRLTKAEDARSPDSWWRVAQFRAYAAWTRTDEFRDGLARVLDEARTQRTAVMCSESVWWRCHRRIVADVAMLAHGVPVAHLMHDGRLMPHAPSEAAHLLPDGALVWSAEAP